MCLTVRTTLHPFAGAAAAREEAKGIVDFVESSTFVLLDRAHATAIKRQTDKSTMCFVIIIVGESAGAVLDLSFSEELCL